MAEKFRNGHLIDLRQVTKVYPGAAGGFVALQNINLQLDTGNFVAVVGKSGSGKSTLINVLTRLDRPTAGEVIGLISWGLGLLLSIPLSDLFSREIGLALLQMPLNYSFALEGAGLWLAVVIFLAALASFWPARNAARFTVRDVLAYE